MNMTSYRHASRLSIRLLALLLLALAPATSFLHAQEQEQTQLAPAPEGEQTQPAPAPEGEQTQPAPAPEGIVLNFRDASLDTVLQHLSDCAGLAVVEEVSVEGRVTVFSRQPLSVDEAVSLLNTVLKERGYAAIRTGRTLTIVTLDEAKKRNIPVRSGSDPALIEVGDEIITQVIPIRYADAVRLKEDLSPLIPSYADLSANESSNALILTDTGANVRRIVEIVKALDTTMASVTDVRVFQLEYAEASDAAELINDVFEVEETSTRQRGQSVMARFFRGPGGPAGGQQGSQGAGRQAQKVTAAADDRTNTVVVSGPPETLDVVERVLKDLDSDPAEEEAVLVYKVKNGQAANIVDVLNELFSQTEQSAVAGGRGGQQSARQRFATMMRGGTTQAASDDVAGLAGEVYLVADEDSNSILVLTAPKNFDTVRAVLEELDKPVPQVLIKVLIAEVTHDSDLDLGFEFSVLNLGSDGRGQTLFTDFGLAAETGGLIARIVHGDLTATLRALEKIGKLEVLSRPYILTSDNQEASITVGQEVPFITDSRTTETGQTINTIQYEDIGIILNVTPHINVDGLVIMDISPEISNVTDSTVQISETVDAFVIAKRSASSHVSIQDGQTIVIGGLMQDSKTETIRRVPVLGSIPVVGAMFRRTHTKKAKTELLIFLTPHVAKQATDLERMSADERAGAVITPGAVEPGAFDSHMKGLQRGAAEQGEKDE